MTEHDLARQLVERGAVSGGEPMTDPRRKLIAEAMEVRENRSRYPLEAAYDALPVAVELIEELTAKVRHAEGERDYHADHSLEQLDRAEKAEARVRGLEGEVKMLRVSRDALRNNNEVMHRRLAAEQEEGT